MIDGDDIKRKDFSAILPNIIVKMQVLSDSLLCFDDAIAYGPEATRGFALLFNDLIGDLEKINKALYGGKTLT